MEVGIDNPLDGYVQTSMEGMPDQDCRSGKNWWSDVASSVTEEAIRIGAEVDFIIESDQYDEFDQGLIDWRTILGQQALASSFLRRPIFGDSKERLGDRH